MTQPLFHFVFEDQQAAQTLVLLHGTGADERDLLPIGRQQGKAKGGYNLLSLRGNVQEQGMNRFFARKAIGVFDQESINDEVAKLEQFLNDWLAEHNQNITDLSFLGFSNGANMILALAFLHPELVHQAVLLHPMLPFMPEKIDLSKKSFLVSYGQEDPMVPVEQSVELIRILKQLGAEVVVSAQPNGHHVSKEELEEVERFFATT